MPDVSRQSERTAVEIKSLSIMRLKPVRIVIAERDFACRNQKPLNYEIETENTISELDTMRESRNQKPLNYEIETGQTNH